MTRGRTTCPACHLKASTVRLEVQPRVFDYTGPQACPRCGRGYEPEDFKPDQHQAPRAAALVLAEEVKP